MPEIDIRTGLDEREFVREYMHRRKPVVVNGCMESWRASERWTIPFLRRSFGDLIVLIQGSTFRPVGVERLKTFLDVLPKYDEENHFGRADVPYVRYTCLHGVDTDDLPGKVLDELTDDWTRPCFLPLNLYVVPKIARDADPSSIRFPSFGLYVSPRGACTSLHVDADLTSAVSCQFRGRKRWFVFDPERSERLPRRAPPPTNILEHSVPDFGGTQPTYVFTIEPGQILYLPGDWYHEVYTVEASVSLTFNFVHLTEARQWIETLCRGIGTVPAGLREGARASKRILATLGALRGTIEQSKTEEHRNDIERWGVTLPELIDFERTLARLETAFL